MNTKATAGLVGAVVLLIGMGTARTSTAQGFYLGGAASHAAINETVIDDTRNAYKVFFGFETPAFLGLEVAWVDFGDFDGVITSAAGNTGVGYDAKTATVALTGRIPLGGFLSLTGKTGYMYWSTDVTLTGTVIDPHFTEGTDHGRDWFYGAGARLEFGHVAVIGEWERYKLRDLDINAVSAGLRYTF